MFEKCKLYILYRHCLIWVLMHIMWQIDLLIFVPFVYFFCLSMYIPQKQKLVCQIPHFQFSYLYELFTLYYVMCTTVLCKVCYDVFLIFNCLRISLKRRSNMACAQCRDEFIPGGNHANPCLAWNKFVSA